MNERYSIPIYLNISMLQNLTSTLIDGYYNTHEARNTSDIYVLARNQKTIRRQNTDDIKTSQFPASAYRISSLNSPFSIRGPKTDEAVIAKEALQNVNLTLSLDEAILNYDECFCLVEGRDAYFKEQRTIRNYTLYKFFPKLVDYLECCGILKSLPASINNLKDICIGDYVEFCGVINISTITTYLTLVINILNSYGVSYLDENVDTEDIGPLNYSIIASLLTALGKSLANNSSSEYIAIADNYTAVITLVNEYTSSGYLTDINGNKAKIIGKVTGLTGPCKDSISLLDKTGYTCYYLELLQTISPYLARLNEKGYLVPTDYISTIHYPAINVIPLAIYV